MGASVYEKELSNWIVKEKKASKLAEIINYLWLEKSTELVLFRKKLIDQNVSEILNLHTYARNFVKKNITINETVLVAQSILENNVKNSKIDLGKLTFEYITKNKTDINEFTRKTLNTFINNNQKLNPKDVILYGFGRIGRLVARELIAQEGAGNQLRLRAIVTRSNSEDSIIKRASLLRTDSVHGKFPGTVYEDLENKSLVINGRSIPVIASSNPDKINYTEYGIKNALVIDNTGAFRDDQSLNLHLNSNGVSKVLLTAPGKNIPNIVFGINHDIDVENENIFSAASCTTNAITPILNVVENNLKVNKAHIETIHAYTNDQNLVDNMHKKYRRGRAAALNMVITETGAGKAVTKAIPSLKNKITSSAIRVPTPNVSLAILNISIDKKTSFDELNELMRKSSLDGNLVEQIRYSTSNELVSSDIVGDCAASIYDSCATQVSNDGKNIVLYVWYDNEFGYTRQVIRLAKYISKVRRKCYY